MRPSVTRALIALGFSTLFALTAACGGSTPEAKAPTGDPADALRGGSPAPDLAADTLSAGTAGTTSAAATTEPPKTTAVSSSDNGSDIIPPFTSGKEPATSAAPNKKGSKKGSGKTAGKKPKKKAAGA